MRRLLTLCLSLLAFCLLPTASSVAAPQAAVAESRDTIVSIAQQMAFGQWTSPVSVTINQLVYPIRWGTFVAGRKYTGEAYTQQNPQDDWSTFSYNMRNGIGKPGVDQGTDCSGFTSIAWQIPRNWTWTFLGNGHAYTLGSHDELAPGDALLIEAKHIAVFYERLDSGILVMLEQTDPQALRSEWSWAYANTYMPVRRVGVTDSYATPVSPPREAPLQNYVTASQSVTFRWRASTTSGVDAYRVRVADSAAKVATGPWILDVSVSASTTSLTRTISARGDLHWNVQACKGCSTGSPSYSTGTSPWKLTIRPPSGTWAGTYYSGTSFNTACATDTTAASHLFKDWLSSSPGSCPIDYWSARFTQSVTFPGGRYNFYLGSDDWGRIKLDGVTIVNNWQGAGGSTAALDVSAGTHTVTVEYAEVAGLARLSAWWSGPGFDLPNETKDPGQWYAQYYGNKDLLWAPVVRHNEGSGYLHHEWEDGSPGWGLPADQFSARFERTVYFPCGLYQFRLRQNNGARAYLDGAAIPGLDHWIDADTRYTSLIRVPEGNHTVRVDYFESTAAATIGFDWARYLACPGSPSPADGQSLVAPDSVLSWAGDAETVYPVKYTVYLNRSSTGGAINPTTAICTGTSSTTCDPPGDLVLNSHYYWKVKADDGTGDVVESPIWDFWTTGCPIGQLRAQHFAGTSLSGSAVSSACQTPPLNLDWGGGGPSGTSGDSFSARYAGVLEFLEGPYTFTVTADDGVRLWVDGVLLIDQWKDQAPTTYQATRQMTAGRHTVQMEYFEHLGGALVKLSWQVASCPTGLFRAQYFANTTLEGTPLATGCVDDPLSHDWGEGRPVPGIGVDNFSARWSGTFDFAAGDYTFVAMADDGVKLWVDGVLVIDQWKVQPPTTYRATRTLTAGPHTVRMDYYEAGGGAVAKLDWQRSETCAAGEYQAQYFANKTLSGTPSLSRCESAVDHDWGNGGPAGLSSDGFSARWTGTYDFGAGGAYTFVATADDGVRVWVDGVLVIDQWKDQPPTTYQATRNLAAGAHVVRVEYFENGGGAVAQVSWVKDCPTGQLVGLYYNNRSLSGTATMVRCESVVNYDWGSGGPGGGIGADNFSVRWRGTFDFEAGNYTFWARTDDGVQIYVDDVLILNGWYDRPPTLKDVTRSMTAGRHSVRIEYYESGGGAVAQAGWNKQ